MDNEEDKIIAELLGVPVFVLNRECRTPTKKYAGYVISISDMEIHVHPSLYMDKKLYMVNVYDDSAGLSVGPETYIDKTVDQVEEIISYYEKKN